MAQRSPDAEGSLQNKTSRDPNGPHWTDSDSQISPNHHSAAATKVAVSPDIPTVLLQISTDI